MPEAAPEPERLALTPAVRDTLFAHAREGARDGDDATEDAHDATEDAHDATEDASVEVCGVLSGEADGATARVTALRRVPNVADDPRARYEFDPEATVAAIETLEAEGLTHLGFYHSHPTGPPGPSRTDEARATWPGYAHLIVSLGEAPRIGAWRWTGERFVQLPVVVDAEGRTGP